MANGAFKFKDNSGNVVAHISGSGTGIMISGSALGLTGSIDVVGSLSVNGSPLISGYAQLTGSLDSRYVLSGSITQTTWDNIASKPAGIVSGSGQVFYSGITGTPSGLLSGSSQVFYSGITGTPSGLLSGSSQVFYSGITGTPSGLLSGSSQVYYSGITGTPSGIVSGSGQIPSLLPSGTVSGSAQVDVLSTLNIGRIATTGSNTFNANQTINGNLIVTGSLTAQQFIVSSSVTYLTESFASGSHKFGDSADDNHDFTGSVRINGSIVSTTTALVSGSSQIAYTGLTNVPSGIVSGSGQIPSLLPSGTVSGSAQIISNLPSGTVSGSVQVGLTGTTGFGTYLNQAVLSTSSPSFAGITSTAGLTISGTNLYTFNKPTATAAQTVALFGTQAGGLYFTSDNAIISKGAYYLNGWIATNTAGSLIDLTANSNNPGIATFTGATAGNPVTFSTTYAILHAGNYTTYTVPTYGATTINTLGTITGGTWNGAAISNSYLANSSFNIGTTSISLGRVSASQTLTGVSIDGNAATATSATSASSATSATSASQLGGLTKSQLWNNSGQSHGTYVSFSGITDYGEWFVHQDAGVTDGPTGLAYQYYTKTVGLGNDYTYSNYVMQTAINRYGYGTTFYTWVRYREAGTWQAWNKMAAGYADTAGALSSMNISQFTNNSGYLTSVTNISGNAGTVTNGVYTTGDQSISGTKTFAVIKGDSGADYPHSFTNTDAGNTHWTNRNGRMLTSNGTNWAGDGKDPIMAIVCSRSATTRGSSIGLTLHNDDTTNNAFSPMLSFSSKSDSLGYNTMYASISGRKTGYVTGVDTNWATGELHFYAHGTSYVGDTPNLLIQPTLSTFSTWIAAGSLKVGPGVYGPDVTYQGLKHSSMASAEYMIISANLATYISAASGQNVHIRPNANASATGVVIDSGGAFRPETNNSINLGTASYRWQTIYTMDLSLKNEHGDYTIVEGEENLYLYNNKSNKVFTFNLTEVDPTTAPPKKP